MPHSVAKKLTGHETDDVFDRYDIVDEQDLSEAVTKVGRYLGRRKVPSTAAPKNSDTTRNGASQAAANSDLDKYRQFAPPAIRETTTVDKLFTLMADLGVG
ncbi:MAG TPA: hypothetical protein VIF64_19100 [Pyrinomonadaceae bacterium]